MQAKEELQNQTIFGQVEPILDNSSEKALASKREAERLVLGTRPWFKRPKILIMLVSTIIILLLVVLMFLATQPAKQPEPVSQPDVVPTKAAQALDLPAQIEQQRQELKRLDFQDNTLAFPQIDRKIDVTLRD